MHKKRPLAPPTRTAQAPGLPFSEHELAALRWFRQQYWKDERAAQVPDQAIAYMILRVALGHPEQVATWIDEMIHYRTEEGVSLSEMIDSRIAKNPEYRRKQRAT